MDDMKNRKTPETETEIREFLDHYDLQSLRLIYQVVRQELSFDADVMMILNGRFSEIRDRMETDGCPIDLSERSIFSERQQRVLSELLQRKRGKNGPQRKTMLTLLSAIFSDDELLERIMRIVCLTFDREEQMQELMERFGCARRGEALLNDPVYQKRRAYLRLLHRYALASTHLYGAVLLLELEEQIRAYESAMLSDVSGYQKDDGTGRTLFYSPAYYCVTQLQEVLQYTSGAYYATFDAVLVHESFAQDYAEELEGLLPYLKQHSMDDDPYTTFYEEISEARYRYLLDEQEEKPMFVPPRKEYLRYADADYREAGVGEKELRKYLKKKYNAQIRAYAMKQGLTEYDAMEEIMDRLFHIASDVGSYDPNEDPGDVASSFMDELESIGIITDDTDRENTLLLLGSSMHNTSRQWINGGYTPNELVTLCRTEHQKSVPVLVPGSSEMARMLEQERASIEGMGFYLDTEMNAATIPTITFPEGISGAPVFGQEKVYPNDPCPCGSGKKYKKCCGRKRGKN